MYPILESKMRTIALGFDLSTKALNGERVRMCVCVCV